MQWHYGPHATSPQTVAFWKGNPLISWKSAVGEILYLFIYKSARSHTWWCVIILTSRSFDSFGWVVYQQVICSFLLSPWCQPQMLKESLQYFHSKRILFCYWEVMIPTFWSRWCFQIFFYFHPYLGKLPILTNIFQLGWNHQIVSGVVGPKLHWLWTTVLLPSRTRCPQLMQMNWRTW